MFCEQKDPFSEHSSVNKKTHFGEQKEPVLEHALRLIQTFFIGFRMVFQCFMLFLHLILRCFRKHFPQVFSLHLRQLFAQRPPAFSRQLDAASLLLAVRVNKRTRFCTSSSVDENFHTVFVWFSTSFVLFQHLFLCCFHSLHF